MPHAAFCTARALQGDLRLLGFGAAADADSVASSGPARRAALEFLAEAIVPGVSDDDALASDDALAKFFAAFAERSSEAPPTTKSLLPSQEARKRGARRPAESS